MKLDKETLIRFLEERAERPLRAKEIARALKIRNNDYGNFKRLLREMEDAGLIYRVRRRRYALPKRINLVVGRLQITRAGHGFVIPDEGPQDDVFIPSSSTGGAYNGDRVVARIEKRRRGKNPEGTLVKVLERARSQVVGVFKRSGRYAFLAPEKGIHRDVFILAGNEGSARDGDMAVARIVDWGSDHHSPVGEIIDVLGRPGDPGVDVLAIIHSHELPVEFPAAVLAESEALAAEWGKSGEPEGRSDLRSLFTFTIDPADAKDHDDALSIEKLDADRWRVGIHRTCANTHLLQSDRPFVLFLSNCLKFCLKFVAFMRSSSDNRYPYVVRPYAMVSIHSSL